MKYSPRQPTRNVNVSHGNPVREFFKLVAGAAVFLFALLAVLSLLVDYAVSYVDPELEAELFQSFSPSGGEQSEEERALQHLLDQLNACVGVDYPLVLEVVESEEINAFAAPGGRIVVFSQLIKQMDSENGMAFVLAHELAHFKNRDHLRGMGRALVMLVASVMLTGASSDLSVFLTPVYSAEAAQYSQQRETAADLVALHALNCHYSHVGGATDLFEEIARLEEDDWGIAHYFASHPQAERRIEHLREQARAHGYTIQEPENAPQ